jgi:hypothetical protein
MESRSSCPLAMDIRYHLMEEDEDEEKKLSPTKT